MTRAQIRSLAGLLMAANLVVTSVTNAQGYGYGAWGGAQPCPYAQGLAAGSHSDDDEVTDIKQQLQDARKEKSEITKLLNKDNDKLSKDHDAIEGALTSSWADVVENHMDKGFNCDVCGAPVAAGASASAYATATATAGAPPPPNVIYVQQPAPVNPTGNVPAGATLTSPPPATQVPVSKPQPLTPPPPPPDNQAPPTTPVGPVRSENDRPNQNRMPASENPTRMPAQADPDPTTTATNASLPAPAAAAGATAAAPAPLGPQAAPNPFGADKGAGGGGSFGGGGGYAPQTLCNPPEAPYTTNPVAWGTYCRPDGGFDPGICKDSYYTSSDAKGSDLSKCARAIGEYRKLTKAVDKLQKRLDDISDKVDDLNEQLGDARSEQKEQESEGICMTCAANGNVAGGGGGGDGGGFWKSFLPIAAGVVGAGAFGTLAYMGQNRINNQNAALGWPSSGNPGLAAAGAGFPFMAMGIDGAIASSQTGAYGCAGMAGGGGYPGGVNGMSPYGPGYGSPYGVGGSGGAFGYPSAYYGQPLGGGAFMPGMSGYPGAQLGINGGLGVGGPFGLAGGASPFGFAGGASPFGLAGGASPFGLAGGASPFGLGVGGGFGLGATAGANSAMDNGIASSYIGAGLNQEISSLNTRLGAFNSGYGLAGYSGGYSGYPGYSGYSGAGLGVNINAGFGLSSGYSPYYGGASIYGGANTGYGPTLNGLYNSTR